MKKSIIIFLIAMLAICSLLILGVISYESGASKVYREDTYEEMLKMNRHLYEISDKIDYLSKQILYN